MSAVPPSQKPSLLSRRVSQIAKKIGNSNLSLTKDEVLERAQQVSGLSPEEFKRSMSRLELLFPQFESREKFWTAKLCAPDALGACAQDVSKFARRVVALRCMLPDEDLESGLMMNPDLLIDDEAHEAVTSVHRVLSSVQASTSRDFPPSVVLSPFHESPIQPFSLSDAALFAATYKARGFDHDPQGFARAVGLLVENYPHLLSRLSVCTPVFLAKLVASAEVLPVRIAHFRTLFPRVEDPGRDVLPREPLLLIDNEVYAQLETAKWHLQSALGNGATIDSLVELFPECVLIFINASKSSASIRTRENVTEAFRLLTTGRQEEAAALLERTISGFDAREVLGLKISSKASQGGAGAAATGGLRGTKMKPAAWP